MPRVDVYITQTNSTAQFTGAGLTFIVSKTDYNDVTQTCSMTCGIPDDMSIFLAQLAAGKI